MDYGSTDSSPEEELTCIQDTATSPARSSVVSTIPNQNTKRTRKTSFKILPLIKTLNLYVFIYFFSRRLPGRVCNRDLLLEAVFAGR